MLNLKDILASTRPGRKGIHVAEWILEKLNGDGRFNTELLDLAKINLPFFDEPQHPRLRKYEKEHTKEWSRKIDEADAFIIVTSEYNFGFPATIKNAIDFLYHEWRYKAVGIVAYGGVAAGTRATQMLKPVITTMNMMPINESVNIPFFTNYIKDDRFVADESLNKSADLMLTELNKWAEALKPIRNSKP